MPSAPSLKSQATDEPVAQPSPASQLLAHPAPPIITLLSDFGTDDWYVAAMKLAILRVCPTARLIDVTHAIAPGDVLAGSIQLERAVASGISGCVHLAVVDPGVGSARRILVARSRGQTIICPDNGLLTWTLRRHGLERCDVLHWRPAGETSNTFHGRDIMAPAAGLLARGSRSSDLPDSPVPLAPTSDIVELPIALRTWSDGVGEIIHIDRFGNATTNILLDSTGNSTARPDAPIVHVGPRALVLRRTYSDVAPQVPLALIGGSGLLELAVRDGSAAAVLGLKIGTMVRLMG